MPQPYGIPYPTTISKSYTIHTDAIKPHKVFKSIAKLLSNNDDPTKHPKKKIYTPQPIAAPFPVPVPVPTPVSISGSASHTTKKQQCDSAA